jgi:hypothetical protein
MKRLVIIFALALGGCGSAGDFCSEKSDCPAELICSIKPGEQRGVCTYKAPRSDVGALTQDRGSGG